MKLLRAATGARDHAYAPYSRYRVGAAVLDEGGRIHVGCNVENASYGLTVCAERNAVAAAVATGARHIRAVAVVTVDGGTPCGACRQVISQFATRDTPVMIASPKALFTTYDMHELLPDAFASHRRRKRRR